MQYRSRINALSIDLEDWYHPEFIRKDVNLKRTGYIKDSTEIVLNLLKKYNIKATFFVLGEIALANPELTKKICREGHEIAAHGFSHKTLHDMGPDGLRNELSEFKKVITSIMGDIEIKGFRAPTFSLNQDTSWAVDILKEFKIRYDSSIFPIKLGFYGVDGAPLNIYGLNSNDVKLPDERSNLKEFPITVFEYRGMRFPVSGGFYLRTMPFYLQKRILKLINKDRPFIIYVHPWEFSADIPRTGINPLFRFISYYNIKSTLAKFEGLLNNFNFDRIDNVLGV